MPLGFPRKRIAWRLQAFVELAQARCRLIARPVAAPEKAVGLPRLTNLG